MKFSQTWDFDHTDGDRGNNNTSNCQALCPTCHALKTRGSGFTS
ncbi:MAG: HNH endonuclease signature motif containing protein [Nitrosopumilus sp.]